MVALLTISARLQTTPALAVIQANVEMVSKLLLRASHAAPLPIGINEN
jgi:hypothetical protein